VVLDIFFMPTFFFISGFFAPTSLERAGAWGFLKARFRRLMLPWLVAVLTLMPLYKVIFLFSRDLPAESWTTYLHFNNSTFGMMWLWFLPALFLFNGLFLALRQLNLPMGRRSFRWALAGVLIVGFASTLLMDQLGLIGWTKTALIDFQNERLLLYFLFFLLGCLGSRCGVFNSRRRNMKLYIAINATAWIPVTVYVVLLLSFIIRPGTIVISATADMALFWLASMLSMISLGYCMVETFRYTANRRGRLLKVLAVHSYNVYIVHMIVTGVFALGLLQLDLPSIVKYPILIATSYVGSYLVVIAASTVAAWMSNRLREHLVRRIPRRSSTSSGDCLGA